MNRLYFEEGWKSPGGIQFEHALLCSLMGCGRSDGRWLYAVTQAGLWIRSPFPPPIGHCAAEPDLVAGAELAFFGVLNPTVSVFTPGTRGKRKTCDGPPWLAKRLEGAAELVSIDGAASAVSGVRQGEIMTLGRWECRGVLRVTDPTALADLVNRGIGRGKGYGLGLLVFGATP